MLPITKVYVRTLYTCGTVPYLQQYAVLGAKFYILTPEYPRHMMKSYSRWEEKFTRKAGRSRRRRTRPIELVIRTVTQAEAGDPPHGVQPPTQAHRQQQHPHGGSVIITEDITHITSCACC